MSDAAVSDPGTGPSPPPASSDPTGPSGKGLAAALGTLAAAIVALLKVFDAVDWTDAQTALVLAEAAAVISLATAIWAHFRRNTPKEPVVVAASVTALITATIALGAGFSWWNWTTEQTSAVLSAVTAVSGVLSALLARAVVTPTNP
jgi:drug/metabolite transporter (DMT)-like permease